MKQFLISGLSQETASSIVELLYCLAALCEGRPEIDCDETL
jgi:hypothetical protein